MPTTKWRLGHKVPINVYAGDRPVCQCHNEEDARLIVEAVNAPLGASADGSSLKMRDDIDRVAELEEAIRAFIRDRGRHDSEHVYCCANGGRCLRCEESYIRAEAKLDAVLERH